MRKVLDRAEFISVLFCDFYADSVRPLNGKGDSSFLFHFLVFPLFLLLFPLLLYFTKNLIFLSYCSLEIVLCGRKGGRGRAKRKNDSLRKRRFKNRSPFLLGLFVSTSLDFVSLPFLRGKK